MWLYHGINGHFSNTSSVQIYQLATTPQTRSKTQNSLTVHSHLFSAVGLVLLTVRQLERMHYASAYTVPTDVIIIHSVRWNVTPQLFTHKVVSPVAVAVVIVTTDLWQFILIVEIERWRWRKWFPDIILLQFCSFWVVVELWWPAFWHRKNFA